ncbi:MAG: alpha/beta hydrolase [Chloroflexota bacterium]
MPYVSLPFCDLYYEVYGSGPALVFAHGAGGNHLTWWQQVPAFRDRYTCITYAQRGFGPSHEREGGPSFDALTDDLEALISHLGLDSVALVGQSMGGWPVLGYALRHPGRVRGVVMSSTVGSVTEPTIDRAIQELRAAGHRERLTGLGIQAGCGERLAREQPAMHFLYGQISALPSHPTGPALLSRLHALRVTPSAALAALTMPFLLITGEEDIVMPPSAVARLSELLPNARLFRAPETGHSVYWERPATFNREVGAFLDSL